MKTLRDKRVLITGGARGIGLAIARGFADKGAQLILADLDPDEAGAAAERLREEGASASSEALDVSDVASVRQLQARLKSADRSPDVLVNNAGVVFGGTFLEVPLERHLLTYKVNTLGLMTMTHVFLPDLIARPESHLVQIASASSFVGLPLGATYASSKWAVLGLSESIRLELAQQGHRHVGVSAICPSYVNTGMFDGVRPPRATRMLTPTRVADLTVGAVLRNRPQVLAPWLVRVTPTLKGLLPTRWFDRICGLFGATTGMAAWKGRA